MKLNDQIIVEISKKLKTGIPAKWAAQAEGITERTYHHWKSEGEEIFNKVTDKDGEIIQSKYKKLNETENLKFLFFRSISQSIAEGHSVLVAAVYSHIKDDWKAAMEILSRRFPKEWAKRDHLHVEQEVTEKPNKLKELEDKHFKDVPKSKMKEVISDMEKVIEGARNGKPAAGPEEQS